MVEREAEVDDDPAPSRSCETPALRRNGAESDPPYVNERANS